MTKFFRNLHIYLSLFFLPLALLYAISGALNIIGIDESFDADIKEYTLNKHITKGDEAQSMLDYLSQNSIKLPANHPTHSKDENVIANLGTIYYSASIKMLDDDTYQIATKTRSFLGILMSLHEAKDNSIFDILAIGFAITLIVLYNLA